MFLHISFQSCFRSTWPRIRTCSQAHRISQASPTTRSQPAGTDADPDQLQIDQEDNPLFGQNDKTLQQRRQKQHHLHWNLHYLHWLNRSLMASWCILSHFWLKLCKELITWPCLHQTSGGSHSWTGHGSLLSWWQRCASTSSVQQVINAGGMMVSASTCLHPHLYCLCMSEPQLIPIMNIYIYTIDNNNIKCK